MTLLCATFSWILQKAAAEGVVWRMWTLRVCMDVVGVWSDRVVSVSHVWRALCVRACFSWLSIGKYAKTVSYFGLSALARCAASQRCSGTTATDRTGGCMVRAGCVLDATELVGAGAGFFGVSWRARSLFILDWYEG